MGRGVRKLVDGGLGLKRKLFCGRRGTSSTTLGGPSSSFCVLVPNGVPLGGVMVLLRCEGNLICPGRLLGENRGLFLGL